MVEGILPQDRNQARDDLLIRNRAMLLDPLRCIFITLASKPHDNMSKGFAEELIFGLAALLERRQFCWSFVFQLLGFRAQSIRFLVVERPHIGLGNRSGRAKK